MRPAHSGYQRSVGATAPSRPPATRSSRTGPATGVRFSRSAASSLFDPEDDERQIGNALSSPSRNHIRSGAAASTTQQHSTTIPDDIATQPSRLLQHLANMPTLPADAARMLADHLHDLFGDGMCVQKEIPLTCAISRRRMDLPVRGRLCAHVECFDAQSWVDMALQHRSLRDLSTPCPICRKKVLGSQLVHDIWLRSVLASPDYADWQKIVLLPDGRIARPLPNAAHEEAIDLSTQLTPARGERPSSSLTEVKTEGNGEVLGFDESIPLDAAVARTTYEDARLSVAESARTLSGDFAAVTGGQPDLRIGATAAARKRHRSPDARLDGSCVVDGNRLMGSRHVSTPLGADGDHLPPLHPTATSAAAAGMNGGVEAAPAAPAEEEHNIDNVDDDDDSCEVSVTLRAPDGSWYRQQGGRLLTSTTAASGSSQYSPSLTPAGAGKPQAQPLLFKWLKLDPGAATNRSAAGAREGANGGIKQSPMTARGAAATAAERSVAMLMKPAVFKGTRCEARCLVCGQLFALGTTDSVRRCRCGLSVAQAERAAPEKVSFVTTTAGDLEGSAGSQLPGASLLSQADPAAIAAELGNIAADSPPPARAANDSAIVVEPSVVVAQSSPMVVAVSPPPNVNRIEVLGDGTTIVTLTALLRDVAASSSSSSTQPMASREPMTMGQPVAAAASQSMARSQPAARDARRSATANTAGGSAAGGMDNPAASARFAHEALTAGGFTYFPPTTYVTATALTKAEFAFVEALCESIAQGGCVSREVHDRRNRPARFMAPW